MKLCDCCKENPIEFQADGEYNYCMRCALEKIYYNLSGLEEAYEYHRKHEYHNEPTNVVNTDTGKKRETHMPEPPKGKRWALVCMACEKYHCQCWNSSTT